MLSHESQLKKINANLELYITKRKKRLFKKRGKRGQEYEKFVESVSKKINAYLDAPNENRIFEVIAYLNNVKFTNIRFRNPNYIGSNIVGDELKTTLTEGEYLEKAEKHKFHRSLLTRPLYSEHFNDVLTTQLKILVEVADFYSALLETAKHLPDAQKKPLTTIMQSKAFLKFSQQWLAKHNNFIALSYLPENFISDDVLSIIADNTDISPRILILFLVKFNIHDEAGFKKHGEDFESFKQILTNHVWLRDPYFSILLTLDPRFFTSEKGRIVFNELTPEKIKSTDLSATIRVLNFLVTQNDFLTEAGYSTVTAIGGQSLSLLEQVNFLAGLNPIWLTEENYPAIKHFIASTLKDWLTQPVTENRKTQVSMIKDLLTELSGMILPETRTIDPNVLRMLKILLDSPRGYHFYIHSIEAQDSDTNYHPIYHNGVIYRIYSDQTLLPNSSASMARRVQFLAKAQPIEVEKFIKLLESLPEGVLTETTLAVLQDIPVNSIEKIFEEAQVQSTCTFLKNLPDGIVNQPQVIEFFQNLLLSHSEDIAGLLAHCEKLFNLTASDTFDIEFFNQLLLSVADKSKLDEVLKLNLKLINELTQQNQQLLKMPAFYQLLRYFNLEQAQEFTVDQFAWLLTAFENKLPELVVLLNELPDVALKDKLSLLHELPEPFKTEAGFRFIMMQLKQLNGKLIEINTNIKKIDPELIAQKDPDAISKKATLNTQFKEREDKIAKFVSTLGSKNYKLKFSHQPKGQKALVPASCCFESTEAWLTFFTLFKNAQFKLNVTFDIIGEMKVEGIEKENFTEKLKFLAANFLSTPEKLNKKYLMKPGVFQQAPVQSHILQQELNKLIKELDTTASLQFSEGEPVVIKHLLTDKNTLDISPFLNFSNSEEAIPVPKDKKFGNDHFHNLKRCTFYDDTSKTQCLAYLNNWENFVNTSNYSFWPINFSSSALSFINRYVNLQRFLEFFLCKFLPKEMTPVFLSAIGSLDPKWINKENLPVVIPLLQDPAHTTTYLNFLNALAETNTTLSIKDLKSVLSNFAFYLTVLASVEQQDQSLQAQIDNAAARLTPELLAGLSPQLWLFTNMRQLLLLAADPEVTLDAERIKTLNYAFRKVGTKLFAVAQRDNLINLLNNSNAEAVMAQFDFNVFSSSQADDNSEELSKLTVKDSSNLLIKDFQHRKKIPQR